MNNKSLNYSGIYKDMIEVLGEKVTLEVYKNYKGQQVTFPMRLYSKKYVLDYIKENYDGTNVKQLSRDLGYTEKWIRQIIYKSNIDK
ncbi:Mor transcription activator family protein [Clostridium baratii]|uniref:Mor transcription activator family protein n=1 Tax=Clostridium baratii TaxID=1561 RepID=UPI002904C6EB|nr:Mor transcription activator family protein [Clostridium baratii]MDU1855557.1 Mor transcription activator family protein [Clostridium baratii]